MGKWLDMANQIQTAQSDIGPVLEELAKLSGVTLEQMQHDKNYPTWCAITRGLLNLERGERYPLTLYTNHY